MDSSELTFFTIALCVECGQETIGGRGHDAVCQPAIDEELPSRLERVVFRNAREELIAQRARLRK